MSEISVKKQNNFLFTPKDLDQAMSYATMIANSSFCPKGFNGKPGDVLVAMQMGAEVGLPPMQALQNIAVINGRPSLWGDAALAVVMSSNNYATHKEWISGTIKDETLTAHCAIVRKGSEEYTATFSMTQAKKAGLWGKPGVWQQYPERMLQMRARGFALRDKFADALRGLNIAEEVEDYVISTDKKQEAKTIVSNLIASKKDNIGANNIKIMIDHCVDIESLTHVGKICADISNNLTQEEKNDLREYYKKKQELLSEKKEVIEITEFEESTREITDETLLSSPGMGYEMEDRIVLEVKEQKQSIYDQVKKQILKAKSRDTLDIAADMIRECEEDKQEELKQLYIKRQSEIK